jgi:hypothetical protein
MSDPQKDVSTAYEGLPEINSYDEIPAFRSEDEEDAFWSTHTLGQGLLNNMARRPLTEALKEIGFSGRLSKLDRKPRSTKKPR